jgi:hypothetical protein
MAYPRVVGVSLTRDQPCARLLERQPLIQPPTSHILSIIGRNWSAAGAARSSRRTEGSIAKSRPMRRILTCGRAGYNVELDAHGSTAVTWLVVAGSTQLDAATAKSGIMADF